MVQIPIQQVVYFGDWLVTSGQVGVLNGLLPEGARAQTEQALSNLNRILDQYGSKLDDVFKTTVFLTSMDDYAEMNLAYGEWFTSEPPARSAVAVKELPLGALIEIEAWAHARERVVEPDPV